MLSVTRSIHQGALVKRHMLQANQKRKMTNITNTDIRQYVSTV